MQPEEVLQHICVLGEGPVWDVKQKVICWVDIVRGEIHEFSPETKLHKIISLNQMIGTFAFCPDGNFIVALENGFGFVNRETSELTMVADPESHLPGNRFNDGKCDPAGRFWAGTMSHTDEPEKGSLYTFDKSNAIINKISPVSISNGMAWGVDHKTFYYIDTPTFTVVAYDFDADRCEISNKRIVINIPIEDGAPDGMTIDNHGMLWVAHWDGWQITRWNPNTGEKLLAIPLPVARVTSCTFGGDDLNDLYITTASRGLTDEQLANQPLAGSLFVIKDIGYKGLPMFEFSTGTASF
jgi:sugar lactone lactonase YvrE